MKKLLTVLLGTICLAAILASCGGETVTSPDVTQSVTTEQAVTETEQEKLTDSLPETDMNGYVFRMYNSDDGGSYELHVEEEDGEPINDTMYKRNSVIAERFNMAFENMYYGTISGLWGEVTKGIQASILAGETEYDVMRMRIPNSVTFFGEGYIYPYDDIPHLDLDMPWWNQGVKESLTIAGNVLYTYGDYNLTSYDSTNLMIFNKEMVDNFGLESPYELVNSGIWMYDTMLEMMEKVTSDINGDGVFDINDRWGIYAGNYGSMFTSFFMAAGERVVEKDDDDIPYFNAVDNERLANICKDSMELMWDKNIAYTEGISRFKNPDKINIFESGNALFHTMQAGGLVTARSWELDFGIIPYPKYDESQTQYYTRHEGCYPIMVPITNKNIEYTGIIMEAMAYYSREFVIPAYYDISLKSKGARDSESEQMLDIIFAGRIVDMGDIFFTETVRKPLFNMLEKGKYTYASTVESMRSAAEENINDTIASFIEHFN